MAKFIPNENSFIGFTIGNVGTLAAPATPTAVAAVGSGTLAAAAYHYKISATNDSGESLPSIDATVTTVSVGGVTVGWAPVTGATGYNIYGRLVGVYKLIAQVGLVVTWLDDGSRPLGTPGPLTASTASNIASPSVADVNDAINLTRFTTSLNAMSQGNNVPTPDFSTLFETSILGTSQATFTGDFYRDDTVDTAWLTLARKTTGHFLIARYGGIPNTAGDVLEVWPVRVTSRSMAAMANNTVETFTLTCAVPLEPNEAAVVVA